MPLFSLFSQIQTTVSSHQDYCGSNWSPYTYSFFLDIKKNFFSKFRLRWVAAHRLSIAAASRGFSVAAVLSFAFRWRLLSQHGPQGMEPQELWRVGLTLMGSSWTRGQT